MRIDANRTLALLARSAHELTDVVGRIPAEHLLVLPEPGEWSAHRTLHHLWVVEAHIFLPRVQRVVREEHPFLEVIDEKTLQPEWHAGRPVEEMLQGFLDARQEQISLLRDAEWTREGRHETRGTINLAWLATYTLAHTWEHMAQLMRAALTAELRPPAAA